MYGKYVCGWIRLTVAIGFPLSHHELVQRVHVNSGKLLTVFSASLEHFIFCKFQSSTVQALRWIWYIQWVARNDLFSIPRILLYLHLTWAGQLNMFC